MRPKLNGSLDRTRGYTTPTEADNQCDYFKNRFFEHGLKNERRAVCELKPSEGIHCDYQLIQEDGTPICARYVYWPHFEIIKDAPVIPDLDPIPYRENTKVEVQKKDADGNPLFWDTTVDPPVETTEDTGEPIMVEEYTKAEWFSTQWVDTHEKQLRIRNHVLGWYHEV
jgi:hypothetical protein